MQHINNGASDQGAQAAEVVHGLDAAHAGSTARESAGKDDPVIESGARLSRYLGADGYALYEEFCATNGLVPGETFDEAEAVPLAALAQLAPDYAPTRAEIATAAAKRGTEDPHTVVEAARAAKANGSGTGNSTMYSLVEAARQFGDAAWVTAATREWIAECDQAEANRTAMPTGLAAERLIAFGATAADIAALAPITSVVVNAEARDYAKEQLLHAAEARRERVAEERRLAKLRAEGYIPLAEAEFDYERDFASLREPEMLIPGIIEAESVVQLIAQANVGKTFMALSWACWLATQGKHVIYIVADDSRFQFIRRVLGWCAAHDADPKAVFAKLRPFMRPAQFADPADIGTLAEMVKANGTVMVVFDTQHQCSEGLVENSNDDSRVISAACRRLVEVGATAMLVHHTYDGKTGRGAKSVEGFTTSLLALTKVEEGGRTYLEVCGNKQKNMEKGKKALYLYEEVEIPPALRAGVIRDDSDNRITKVVRISRDPFTFVSGSDEGILEDFKLYGVLWSLRDVPRPLLSSKVHAIVKEHLMPILIAKGYLRPDAKQMPRGFGRGEIEKLLKSLVDKEPPEQWVEDTTPGSDTTAHFQLTDAGKAQLAGLVEALEVPA